MATFAPEALGFFGGTFDPVHVGHITLAKDLQQHLALKNLFLVPCRIPSHREKPVANEQQRLDMLRLAIQNSSLQIDERELHRNGPSYTVDTLQALRQQHGALTPLIWCLGIDAFARLQTWHRWQEILSLAHLAVVTRADYSQNLPIEIQHWMTQHQSHDPAALTHTPAGKIYLTQLSQIPVSSTSLRQQLATGALPAEVLHPAVHQYILERGLYLNR